MKKLFLLSTAAFLITGLSFADNGKMKKKGKCTKSCCSKSGKSCTKKSTAKM